MMNRTKALFLTIALLGATAIPASARDRCWRNSCPTYSGTAHYYTVVRPAPVYSYTYSSACPPNLRPVYGGSTVAAEAQRMLARYGYYDGVVDGVLGPLSRSAIRSWQMDQGLLVTGGLDSATLQSLGLLD